MTISNTTIWNSATAGTDIAISNGLQVYATANPPGDQWCLTTDSITGGQQTYFEITVNTLFGNDAGIGICNASASAAGLGNNATYGCMVYGSYLNNGAVYLNGHEITTSQIGTFTSNATICVAVSGQAVYFRKGATGQWMGNTNTANPTTNTGGAVLTVNYPWYVVSVFSGGGTPQNYTANFGNTAFIGVNPFALVPAINAYISQAVAYATANPVTTSHTSGGTAYVTQAVAYATANPVATSHTSSGAAYVTQAVAYATANPVTTTGGLVNAYLVQATCHATAHPVTTSTSPTTSVNILPAVCVARANQITAYATPPTPVTVLQAVAQALAGNVLVSVSTAVLPAAKAVATVNPLAGTSNPKNGLRIGNFVVKSVTAQETDIDVSLRWSDTRGRIWGNPIVQPLGYAGQYYTSPQFLRLGQGRDRVFEVSWSCNRNVSLVGLYINADPSRS